VAAELKSAFRIPKSKIRINTNGQANLFWGRNILPELKGLIDNITISLNATNSENYQKRCNPAFGEQAFPAVLDFIRESKKYIPEVEISAVDLPDVDRPACEKLAQELGVKLRMRPYYEEKYVR
jgi:TatD family-associated radical SAM protein